MMAMKIAKLVGILSISLVMVFSSCSSGEDYYDLADFQEDTTSNADGGGAGEVKPPVVSNRPIVVSPDGSNDSNDDNRGLENKEPEAGSSETETKQMPLPNIQAVTNPRMPNIELSEGKAIYQFALSEVPNLAGFSVRDYVNLALEACGFEDYRLSNIFQIENSETPFNGIGQDNYIVVDTGAFDNFATSSAEIYITYIGDNGLTYCHIMQYYDTLMIRESTLNKNCYRLANSSQGGLTYELEKFPKAELDRLLAELNKSKAQLTTSEILTLSNDAIINNMAILPYNTVDYLTLYNSFALQQGEVKVSGAAVALNNDEDIDKLLSKHYEYVVQFSWGLNISPSITAEEQINSALGRTRNAKIQIMYDSRAYQTHDACEAAGLNPYYCNLVGAESVKTGDYVPVSYIGINESDEKFAIVWYHTQTRNIYRLTGRLPDDSEVANDRDKFPKVMENLLGGRDEYRQDHNAKIIRQPN